MPGCCGSGYQPGAGPVGQPPGGWLGRADFGCATSTIPLINAPKTPIRRKGSPAYKPMWKAKTNPATINRNPRAATPKDHQDHHDTAKLGLESRLCDVVPRFESWAALEAQRTHTATAQASELSASRWCVVGLDAAERVPVSGRHQFTKRVSCGHAGALGTRAASHCAGDRPTGNALPPLSRRRRPAAPRMVIPAHPGCTSYVTAKRRHSPGTTHRIFDLARADRGWLRLQFCIPVQAGPLFEALTGAPPFSGDTASLVAAHLTAPVPRLSERQE
jgi:hypothetical protein